MKKPMWIILALFSCFVINTNSSVAETDIEIIQSASWTEYQVGEGVVCKTHHFDDLFGGGQDVFIADADMDHPNVALRFVSKADGTRKVVSDWVCEVSSTAAAINGAWFNGSDGMPIQFLRIDGTNLASTHPNAQERGGIVIDSQGKVTCRTRPENGWSSLTEPNVIASEVPIVVDGQPYQWTAPDAPDANYYYSYRAPRSCIGVTEDNHVLLVVVDGRQAPRATGATYANMAELMIALGATDATELDGGGSSTLWGRDFGVLNSPSDGGERSVAMALCLTAPGIDRPFNAELVKKEYFNIMIAGSTQTVAFTFKNTGIEDWDSEVFLATTEPRGRTSELQSTDWISANRVGVAEAGTVAPGETGRFEFQLNAPQVTEPKNYMESFSLIKGESMWFGRENNRMEIAVIPEGDRTATEIIIESRTDGKNHYFYSESGAWADSGATCSAEGTTPGIGTRYGSTYRSKAGLKIAIYRPHIWTAGKYDVSVTWGPGGGRQNPITYKVTDTEGVKKILLDQSSAADEWISLGTFSFETGSGGSVEISNEDINAPGSMYAGAVRYTLISKDNSGDGHKTSNYMAY